MGEHYKITKEKTKKEVRHGEQVNHCEFSDKIGGKLRVREGENEEDECDDRRIESTEEWDAIEFHIII